MDVRTSLKSVAPLLVFGLAVLLVLGFRYHAINFVAESLWAEDGPIFFQGAQDQGFASIVAPYAGYLLVYPRMFALMSMVFPVTWVPYVFFLGWFFSFFVMRWAIVKAAGGNRYRSLLGFFLPLLLLLQPHSGETFLSLTNAQWWLGISLAIICSFPDRFGSTSPVCLAILSLTGPFSILFSPVLIIQTVLLKSYRVLVAVLPGVIIQISILVMNPRPSQPLNTNIGDWLANLKTFITFGSSSSFVIAFSCIFWICLVFLFFHADRGLKAIIVCAVAAYFSALVALKGMPQALNPLGAGSRYFVIPYSLVAIAVFFSSSSRTAVHILACVSIFLVFASSHHKIAQPDVGFNAYAKLSKYENVTRVQLAPVIPDSDAFSVLIRNDRPLVGTSLTPVEGEAGNVVISSGACAGRRGVGLALDVVMARNGYISILWKNEGDLQPKVVKRFYRAGPQRAQFAFSKDKLPVDVYVVLDGFKLSRIGGDKIMCL